MTASPWSDLLALTLREPRRAAERIIALQLSPQAAISGFALAVILNTLLFSLAIAGTPAAAILPAAMSQPFVYAVLTAVILGMAVSAAHQIGQRMEGRARLWDLVAMMAWGQVLRFLAQVAVLAVQLVSPGGAFLLTLAASGWLLWVGLHFLDVAEGFDSLPKAGMLMIFAAAAVFTGLILLSVLIGPALLGIPSNV